MPCACTIIFNFQINCTPTFYTIGTVSLPGVFKVCTLHIATQSVGSVWF